MNDTPGSVDRLTLVAMAAVAYALADCVHEGVGHGGACMLLGGHPGSTPGEGHGLPLQGIGVWFDDAMRFLETSCR